MLMLMIMYKMSFADWRDFDFCIRVDRLLLTNYIQYLKLTIFEAQRQKTDIKHPKSSITFLLSC